MGNVGLISQQVYDQVHAKLSIGFEYLGERRPKNLSEDVAVYRVSLDEKQRRMSRGSRKVRPPQAQKRELPAPGDLRERIIRHARYLSTIWATLIIIDLVTGTPFWSHWPGLAMAALLGLEAAPLFNRGRYKLLYVRFVVIIGALVLVNAFTWTGYPWVMWPAGALIAMELIRRTLARSH